MKYEPTRDFVNTQDYISQDLTSSHDLSQEYMPTSYLRLFKTNAIFNFQDIMESKHFMTTPFNSLSNTSLCVKNDD